VKDFHLLVSAYQRSLEMKVGATKEPKYLDTLVLAGMAIGLGGGLRPSEYLKAGPTQRIEAILSINQVRFHMQDSPTPVPASALQAILRGRPLSPIGPAPAPTGHVRLRSVDIHLRCAKTDQNKRGYSVPIKDPVCVRLIGEYLLARPMADSAGQPLEPFLLDIIDRTPMQCAAIRFTEYMRTFMARHGVSNPHDYSLKSLRSGAVESIADGEARKLAIATKGGWSNFRTPSNRYCNVPSSK
jgi:hypothetical protein